MSIRAFPVPPVIARFLIAGLLALGAGQASAQPVYKCTVNGKISYGEAPCSPGAAQQQLAPPALPPASPVRNEGNTKLRQEAEQLSEQRHRREAREEQTQQRADKNAARERKKCDSLKLHQRWAAEDAAHDRNAGKDSAKTTLKARRADEKWAMECAR